MNKKEIEIRQIETELQDADAKAAASSAGSLHF